MGDGTKENPYTREDVLRLIEENNGKTGGLNLSGTTFESGINLSRMNLVAINLEGTYLQGANLSESNLGWAKLSRAHLEGSLMERANLNKATLHNAHLVEADLTDASLKEAYSQSTDLKYAILHGTDFENCNLEGAHLEEAQLFRAKLNGAKLYNAHLEGTDFSFTNLAGANLYGAQFVETTKFQDTKWGDYKIGEEINNRFDLAEDTYRRLKQWYTNAGIYNVAGEFFYREMEAKRKNLHWLQPKERRWLGWWPLRGEKARLNIYRWLYGYGERPWRVLAWAALVVSGLALIYFIIGSVWEWSAFLRSLYFSAVSFTALGYGSWIDETWVVTANNYIRGLGAAESFIGIFSIALFLITFTRKMRR